MESTLIFNLDYDITVDHIEVNMYYPEPLSKTINHKSFQKYCLDECIILDSSHYTDFLKLAKGDDIGNYIYDYLLKYHL